MKKIKIQIPNMQTSHCIKRVSNAIKAISGVEIINVLPGHAEVELNNEDKQNELLQSIENLGYSVSSVESLEENVDSKENILKFKTNINCSSCVESITNPLNEAEGICHWDVDTGNKDKILSVHSEGITREKVMDIIKNAGYKIESINP